MSNSNQETKSPFTSLHFVKNTVYLLQNGPDMICQHLKTGKEWEPQTQVVVDLLLQNIQNPVVVDIGANLGAFSVPVGKKIADRGGRLYAFEPQRMVYYQLCANFFANALTHCHAFQLAVGAQSGEIDVPFLDVFKERNLGSLSLDESIRKMQKTLSTIPKTSEKVKMVTLSEMKLPKAHLIKIDVEGLELEVLIGAEEFLKESLYPPILFEVWGDYLTGYIEKREKLLNFVKSNLGYQIDIMGELCIAQHPSNQKIEIKRGANKSFELKLL